MAKATKPKKDKTTPLIIEQVVEETKTGITVPVTEITEPEIVETPPSVTLDEVKEVIEPIKEEPKSVVYTPNNDYVKNRDFAYSNELEISMEQKIINFIESRTGEIKMNDFLKSLYGVPKFGEPPIWLSQGANKELKGVLEKLSNEGQVVVASNAHMKLGTFYYPDTTTMKTEYHTLNSVPLIAVKVN